MTFARGRLIPNRCETLFEAFARLSLLNDAITLQERLICTLPKRRGSPWSKMDDFWNIKLWEIIPTIQVASITPNESVLIDGAFGASIEWEKLSDVSFLKRRTVWRTISNLLPTLALISMVLACTLLSLEITLIPTESKKGNPAIAAGIILMFIALLITSLLPYFVLQNYYGKLWSTKPHLFGIEGHADLDWVETKLFGLSNGRLKWAFAGSTQSAHREKCDGMYIDNEVEALEPIDDPLPIYENLPPDTVLDPDRLFTLVDTYSMTAMVFWAVHPPSVALLCGHEGGMRRALLCSYDYRTQTFHRESVVRMPTKALDRMDRVDGFRFSMKNMPLRKHS